MMKEQLRKASEALANNQPERARRLINQALEKDQNDTECARGLTSFSSVEIEKIKGSHSSNIKNILGYSSREEIIHKDDLVKV